ncbi:MAG: hypothetical protein JW862_19145, partial [Anaerolineales bacterium]|nr:hypothetical protein [Anaerolineales bacterium]
TGKLEFLRRAHEQQARGNRAIVHCPLSAYVIAADGRRTGLVDGEPLFEIPGVYFLTYPLQDGTSWSQFEYPLDQGYRLVLQGQGAGPAQLFVTYGVPEESGLSASSYYYDFEVTAGQELQLPPLPASDLESGAERLPARAFTLAEAGQLEALVGMQLPAELQLEGLEAFEPPVSPAEAGEMTWNIWGLLVCGLCLLGGGLVAAGAVAFYFYRRRR